MKDLKPHIEINLIEVDGKEACETFICGDVQVLSSLVLSSMLSNETFAKIIMAAATCYSQEVTPKEAYLN